MNKVLPAYVRRRVGLQIVALLAVLTLLLQLLELLDITAEILERGLGLSGMLYYAWLRLPSELVQSLPLAVLLGAMTALQALARHLEIATMRAAGVGLMRLFGYLLPVALLLALAQFALSDRVLPESQDELKRWWTASAPPDDASTRLWANSDAGPLSIDRISPDGRHLQGLRLYGLAGAQIVTRLAATNARWDGSRWRLEGVSEQHIGNGLVRPSEEDARAWKTNLRPEDVLRLGVVRPQLSSTMLADVIAGTRVGTQPLSYYRTVLWRSFGAPLGVVVMLLLALPAARVLPRDARTGRETLVTLILGLGFLLCDGIAVTLGTSGRAPPAVAALAVPAVFALIGLLRVQLGERA